VRFYTNGDEDLSKYESANVPTESDYDSDLPLIIGSDRRLTLFFGGSIDDISIWSIAISKERAVRLIWDVPSPREKGLVGFWSFNHISRTDDEISDDGGTIYGKRIGSITFDESITKPLVTAAPCL